jgi:hypothetical protein
MYMLNNITSKLFKKKKFKSEVIILKDDFVAEYYTDSLKSALEWVLHGIYEARYVGDEVERLSLNEFEEIKSEKNNQFDLSLTSGIYGRILPYKFCSIKQSKLTLLDYQKPKTDEHIFMTDTLIHVPETIMKQVQTEAVAGLFIA